MSTRNPIKYGTLVIVAAFALTGTAATATAASPGKNQTQAAEQQTQAQPALPVVTMSAPLTGGSPASGTEAGNEFLAQQLLSGYERGVAEPGLKVVRSQAELEALLQRVYSGQKPPEAPRIDFSQYVLVYYSLGTKMRGNDKIYIRSGSVEHGVLHVSVEIARSSGDCLTTTSLTAPFVIAALPFPAREVRRAEDKVTHENYPCD